MSADEATFEGWAILELMGHRRLAGFVREVTLAGAGFLRLDVPGEYFPAAETGVGDTWDVVATQLYPPSAVYCLTPTTAAIAVHLARSTRPTPVARWELPQPEPEPALAGVAVDEHERDGVLEGDIDDERIPF